MIWHKKVKEAFGPLIVVEGNKTPVYGEITYIKGAKGETLKGIVLEAHENKAVVQVLGNVSDIDPRNSKVHFTSNILKGGVSEDMLGRVFNGTGDILDNGPEIFYDEYRSINGAAINPEQRVFPEEFIQTGVSCIDGLNSLARGQKLPIFSANGLPHAELASQIAKQAKVLGADSDNFAVVFGAMGVTYDEGEFFRRELEKSGALANSVLYLNLASDPVVERISLPRFALTTAEYLAFTKGMHVLVILTDMTNYANALREVSAARKEVPGRMGYPGYLYTDFATLYERCGIVKGSKGSITQIPILTMPSDDKTHPIPDLTGYITEGQILLSRDLQNEGVYPPCDILKSLSRLKNECIGEGKTREDHKDVLNQVFASYAKGKEVGELAKILGEGSLTSLDKKYLTFYKECTDKYIKQGINENRSIVQTLDIAWEILSILPKRELKRIKKDYIEKYYIAR